MPEIEQTLRGEVDMTALEAEELKVIKAKILSKKGNAEKNREEFLEKAKLFQYGIPRAYWDIDWKDFVGDPVAKKKVKKYCSFLKEALECGQGIIFSGSHGTGKTALSVLIAKEAIQQGYTVKYIPVAKIIDMLMQSFDSKSFKENLYIVLERVEVLILDDLGKEYVGVNKQLNPMVQMNFDSILRERLNRNLVTIASTNLRQDEVLHQYGQSVFSVLLGVSKFCEVKGEDFRLIRGKDFWGKVNA